MKLSINENVEKGTIFFDEASGNYFRVDTDYAPLQKGYLCTMIELDEDGEVCQEYSTGWKTKREVERWV